MPRQRKEQPAYSYHVSGQARVRLDYKDFYLGEHGSPASYAKYYALLAEYNANGKVAPSLEVIHLADQPILLQHLTANFRHRVLPRYEGNGGQHNRYSNLCDLLDQRHGMEAVNEFGPRKLEALRDHFGKQGCCRKYCNEKTRCIVRIFRHGVARELVPPERLTALQSLEPLRKGEGKENVKRSPVGIRTIKATLPHCDPVVQAMIRVQLATAMRPSELFKMTPAMIDCRGEVWMYRPDAHKTAHHGKSKAVPILDEALAAIEPYMSGAPEVPCFLTSKATPWNKDTYRRHVTRAAKRAGVEHWTPYQLRHTAAQAVRDAAGPEATQALLGHSHLSTTEIYAKANEEKAIAAARAAPKLTW